ncbi:MAG: TolC family protein, partial [Myxococcota bacterium]
MARYKTTRRRATDSLLHLAIIIGTTAGPSVGIAQVAVIVDGPSDLANARIAKLAAEVQQLTRDDPSPIKIPSQPTHVGDFTIEGAKAQLKAALADRSVKAVVGFGLMVGIAAGDLGRPPRKPVILPYAAPRIQGLPRAKEGTGVRHLAYITGLVDFDRDLRRFREVIRDRKVGFVIDDFVWKTFLARKPDDIKSPADGRDDVVMVPIPATVEGAVAALPKDIEAVYLFSHFRMSFEDMRKFLAELNARKLATYAAAGPEWVDAGAMVTLVPADLETERFRRTALYLRDAMAKESLATLPTAFPRRTELVINMATAQKIGIYPQFELMTEARLVGQDQKEQGPELTLRGAIDEGIKNNPGQQAIREQQDAAKAELRESRGNLLPQVDVNGSFTWIDPDVASSFVNAERTTSVSATAQQILYSPLAFNAYFAQKDLFNSAKAGVDIGELDLILEVIQSYLRVLQTEAVERLNRDNLLRVRTNRALAELRVEIGTSGRQDIARWDIELADGRAETIQASATRNQAEIDL